MATYRPVTPPKPVEIDKFLGVNEAVGKTQIKLGEAEYMRNFKITKNYKAEKRGGHEPYIVSPGPIRGTWEGILNNKHVLLFATNGNLYQRDVDIETSETGLTELLVAAWHDDENWNDANAWNEALNPPVTLIGAISDVAIDFRWFKGKVYIKGVGLYKSYDGTTYGDVVGYIPTLRVSSPPTGGGTAFEEVNLLSSSKRQQFIGNGTATIYQLIETSITSATATVNGTPTAITVNTATGQCTFSVAPINGAIVIITWVKADSASLTLLLSHPYMTDYGVGNDTNMFFFGSSTERNTFRYSYIGAPDYFPALAYTNVDSTQFAITDLVSQYQNLLVFKERSTHIVRPTANPNYTNNTGVNPYNFPYYDLNEAVGNIAPKGVQLVENSPVSLYGSSMWLWNSATGVEDERNAKIISDRVKLSLQDENLSTAITYDSQDEKELWVSVGGKAYIWNYGNDTLYIHDNVTASQILSLNGEIIFSSGSEIRKFTQGLTSDDNVAINGIMRLGFTNLGQPAYTKVIRDAWFPIAPDTRSSVTITFATDRKLEGELKEYTVESRLLDFEDVDFDDFSFNGNDNPQPGYIKCRVKNFVNLQIVMSNNKLNETLTILGANLGAQVTGLRRK